MSYDHNAFCAELVWIFEPWPQIDGLFVEEKVLAKMQSARKWSGELRWVGCACCPYFGLKLSECQARLSSTEYFPAGRKPQVGPEYYLTGRPSRAESCGRVLAVLSCRVCCDTVEHGFYTLRSQLSGLVGVARCVPAFPLRSSQCAWTIRNSCAVKIIWHGRITSNAEVKQAYCIRYHWPWFF